MDVQAIIAVIAAAAGGSAVAATQVKAVSSVVEDFVRLRTGANRSRQARTDKHEARRLLGLRQRDAVYYRHDNVHPLYSEQRGIHPDNRAALFAAAGEDYLAAQSAGTLDVVQAISARLDENLVLIGSPASEGLSRLVFGYAEASDGSSSLVQDSAPLDLPYRLVFSSDKVPPDALARRFVVGKGQVVRPNWYIESDSNLFIPELGEDGWLRSDYLLITRVRNFLTPTALAQGRTIVSIAGTHGTGTRSVELLMRDARALNEISAIVRRDSFPSFQAVLRVADIDHNLSLGSRARRIELIGTPATIGDEPQRWRTAANSVADALTRWMSDDRRS